MMREFVLEEAFVKTNPATKEFTIPVDYDRPIPRLITQGNYNNHPVNITADNFPASDFEVGRYWRTFRYASCAPINGGTTISAKEGLERIGLTKCRPATVREILHFGFSESLEQLNHPIIALGGLHWVNYNGQPQRVCLWCKGNNRTIFTINENEGLFASTQLLAVDL